MGREHIAVQCSVKTMFSTAQSLGLGLWSFFVIANGLAFGWKDASFYLFVLPFALYLRTLTLAWRRWFVR